MNDIENAHAALDRMGVQPNPSLAKRVLQLERMNRAAYDRALQNQPKRRPGWRLC